jgi:hypothetical protein
MHIGYRWESRKEGEHWEDKDVDGWTISKVQALNKAKHAQNNYTCLTHIIAIIRESVTKTGLCGPTLRILLLHFHVMWHLRVQLQPFFPASVGCPSTF